MKLEVGYSFIDAPVCSLDGKKILLSELTGGRKTALFFLRDAACVLAQDYLRQLAEAKPLFEKRGIQVLAFVNASPAGAAATLSPEELPYEVLCDPEGTVYQLYGVGCAPSKEALGDQRTMERIQAAYQAGFQHGTDTGDPLRLPAWFLLDAQGKVTMAHYGVLGDDLPPVTALPFLVENRA